MKLIVALVAIMTFNLVYAEEVIFSCSPMVCTAEYDPATCTYKKKMKAEGSNKCDAIAQIVEELCSKSGAKEVVLESKDLKCR